MQCPALRAACAGCASLSGRRLEEPERLYDREAVLGRDTTSARRPHLSCRRRGAHARARIALLAGVSNARQQSSRLGLGSSRHAAREAE